MAAKLTVSPSASAEHSAPAPSSSDELLSNSRLQANWAGLAAALRATAIALVLGCRTAPVAARVADVQTPLAAQGVYDMVNPAHLNSLHLVELTQVRPSPQSAVELHLELATWIFHG